MGHNNGQTITRGDLDATFKHCNAFWPGVLIEVSSSLKKKTMPYLADDYILGRSRSVHVVVGLDIDYKTKRGTISMWRPSYVKNEQGRLELEATQSLCHQVCGSLKEYCAVVDMVQLFRDEFGDPNLSQDVGLRLEQKDFAPKDLAKGISDSFLIDSAILCQFLDKAEQESKQEQRVVQHFICPLVQRNDFGKRRHQKISSDENHELANNERRV
jgi:hypothetical protein